MRLISACCILLLAGNCLAQEQLSRQDTAAILFSNSFSFTDEGEPVLSVRIMDMQDTIQVTHAKGLRIYPSGPEGPAVTSSGKGKWKFTIKSSSKAVLSYRAVLETLPTSEFGAVRESSRLWKDKGIEPFRMELGALFSFQGTVFDTRETLLCSPTLFETRRDARKYLKGLTDGPEPPYRIVEVLEKRPEGLIVMQKVGGSVSISARNAIWFEPLDDRLTVKDVEYARGFNWHGRQTRSYGGSFYAAADKYGKLAIVNVLPSERHLRGLVPAEIYPNSPMEALKAQSVAARNELFSKIGHRHLADPYLLCADQHCQVYKGLNAERKRANKAVRETRGQVMFDEDDRLADIRYSSTCGGHTEDAHEAWPGVTSPNLKGRFDSPDKGYTPLADQDVVDFLANPPTSWCGGSKKAKSTFRWTKEIKASKLDASVAKKYAVGSVKGIEVLHRGVSGRANKIRITGSKGEAVVDGELVIRRLFKGLKSSLFVVTATMDDAGKAKSWTFRGGGFGHGVGMCQIGAMEMARDSKSAIDILGHYYRNISVKRIY